MKTLKDFQDMTPEQLNAAAAVEVMGWRKGHSNTISNQFDCWREDNLGGYLTHKFTDWSPATNANHAQELEVRVDELGGHKWRLYISRLYQILEIYKIKNESQRYWKYATASPSDRTKAALMAVQDQEANNEKEKNHDEPRAQEKSQRA